MVVEEREEEKKWFNYNVNDVSDEVCKFIQDRVRVRIDKGMETEDPSSDEDVVEASTK